MSERPPAEPYCHADPVFYDLPAGDSASEFAQTRAEAAEGWRRRENDVWIVHVPEDHRMADQGWKIHISGTPANARRLVGTAWEYCVRHRVPFKFLRGTDVLTAHSLKYAPRSSSGKLVTLYPEPDRLHETLTALGQRLKGEEGPYILTDLRWEDGPLYVRYGGFRTRWCPDDDGTPVHAVERPDGTLVPDRRRPVFEVPDWVEVPGFLARQRAAHEEESSAADFPYRIESALHFSNGGGVYAGRDSAGRETVLKEARPHAGLDGTGADAVARLQRERRALERLAGLPGIPELYEYRTVWEHHFLAVRKMPGETLQTWLAAHYPLTHHAPGESATAAYARRALALVEKIAGIVAGVHARGMSFGDLHPGNILVHSGSGAGEAGEGEEDTVSLVDFELADDADSPARKGLGNPGFAEPDTTGTEADLQALEALRIWLLLPLTNLRELDPDRLAQQARTAEERFALPAGTLGARLAPPSRQTPEPLRTPRTVTAASGWPELRDSLARGIELAATPEREDRLFPGDVRQFTADGLTFAHGAAGVLWALRTTGAGHSPEHEDWLLRAAVRERPERAGFYDGAHGVAYVLEEFGHRAAAEELIDAARPATGALRDASLARGMAGIGLNLLHFHARTGTAAYRDEATALAGRVTEAVASGEAPGIRAPRGHGSRAGLLRGWSGPALFLLRLYEATGHAPHLDSAFRALHHDLDLCTEAPDGTLQADGGFRTLPYLETGSAGIALVAAEALAHREDARLRTALGRLRQALSVEFTLEPHLFSGRAGLIAALARLRRDDATGAGAGGDDAQDPALRHHLSALHWHAMSYRGQLAFPGEQLRRLSMDLATGSAGILLALSAALDGNRAPLPFLAPDRAP
ncbi:class III lanthionine synthetase LanKC [Streptomyces iconiensis]|uniref:Class III lanthionine synthetase LanKC n=1 Tax=Streptomyces iconiensis TaxID=1384038 RepID=A0ABT7A5C8_9ACTN|nr:class III lanthionine synthetase LanKC [Streptomyces iconiensis]MDJ1136553.1 class III lanthionine synthetase LanKC [Streptomyces iconiensis]